MRSERVAAHHAQKHIHRKEAKSHPKALLQDDPDGTVGGSTDADSEGSNPENKVSDEVQSAEADSKRELKSADPNAGPAVTPLKSEAQAEDEAAKAAEVVEEAEEEAGLPDSIKTTPEPVSDQPTNEEEEDNALIIAVISLVVLAGVAGAGFSIWMARGVQAKAAAAAGEEGEAGAPLTAQGGEEAQGEAAAVPAS